MKKKYPRKNPSGGYYKFKTEPDSIKNPDGTNRFWSGIFYSPDGCWYWTSSVSDGGYGYLKHMGLKIRAHRFSYLLHKGPITHGLLVCHTCDNRLCVNPDHLFLGTHKDNTQDMMRKGRQIMKGSPPIVTEMGVQIIREAHAAGFKRKKIAKYFGLRPASVTTIVKRKAWRHVA